jgi:hypothetical protein
LPLLQLFEWLANHRAAVEKNVPALIAGLDEADSFFGKELGDDS